jgi:hypothetical protein
MTATTEPEAPIRFGPVSDADLDRLARAAVAKGYTVAVAAPQRRYSAAEEWFEYAVDCETVQGGQHYNMPFRVTAGNYETLLRHFGADIPRAEVLPLLASAQQRA